MDVIVFETEAFYKMIDELTVRIIQNSEKYFKREEWIGEAEARAHLGIKSKSKLQQLRDNIKVEFSQYGKIIRYSRSSILKFLEENRLSLDRF